MRARQSRGKIGRVAAKRKSAKKAEPEDISARVLEGARNSLTRTRGDWGFVWRVAAHPQAEQVTQVLAALNTIIRRDDNKSQDALAAMATIARRYTTKNAPHAFEVAYEEVTVWRMLLKRIDDALGDAPIEGAAQLVAIHAFVKAQRYLRRPIPKNAAGEPALMPGIPEYDTMVSGIIAAMKKAREASRYPDLRKAIFKAALAGLGLKREAEQAYAAASKNRG
jgi:hypothetical protein